MNSIVLEHINDLFDPYDLFSGRGKKIRRSIITRFPDISDKEIKEAEDYLHSFYEYCVKYADIIADKYKTPFLPKGEDAQKEISEYLQDRVKYVFCNQRRNYIGKHIIINIYGL